MKSEEQLRLESEAKVLEAVRGFSEAVEFIRSHREAQIAFSTTFEAAIHDRLEELRGAKDREGALVRLEGLRQRVLGGLSHLRKKGGVVAV